MKRSSRVDEINTQLNLFLMSGVRYKENFEEKFFLFTSKVSSMCSPVYVDQSPQSTSTLNPI